MNIAIIGAGFTGLSAAYELTKRGHRVTVFEKERLPGGLAIGFEKSTWKWSLERHYHHWFTNDTAAINLAHEIGYRVFTKRPKTSVYVEGSSFQLDTPLSVLTFPKLTLAQRLRMGFVLACIRYNPFWKPLENYKAAEVLPKIFGIRAYKLLWGPLLWGKFGDAAKEISLAWFWARVSKRTSSLSYPVGGFLSFAQALEKKIALAGGLFHYQTEVTSLTSPSGVPHVVYRSVRNSSIKIILFDKVIVTVSSSFFLRIAPTLPQRYRHILGRLRGLGAINLILRLRRPFLLDSTYWLSICDTSSPFLAVVEHTNFMNKRYYHNEHIVYIGNYVSTNHPYFAMTDNELLKAYHPFLQKINANYQHTMLGFDVFKTPYAQPIVPVGYSHMIPPVLTPLPNVYLTNVEQVYPWDRGTTYAIEQGRAVLDTMV